VMNNLPFETTPSSTSGREKKLKVNWVSGLSSLAVHQNSLSNNFSIKECNYREFFSIALKLCRTSSGCY